MTNRTRPIAPMLLLLAACGGGGGSPDAGADADTSDAALPACAEFTTPAGSITSYPGSFTGDLVGGGADLLAPAGACADERDWYEAAGEDQVVALTGLTPGGLYGVILDSAADTSFYVATGCADGEPISGQCLLFVDSTLSGEEAEFTAPASGAAYLVIDTFDPELAAGAYTVDVVPAECVADNECTTAEAPRCLRFQCVECVSAFDCDAAAPACAADNTCVASLDECTGDDGAEPDDGPQDATALAMPTAGSPTTASGAICNQPDGEGDWFALVVAADAELGFAVTWAAASGADIDLLIWDDQGELVDAGFNVGTTPEGLRVALTAGTYFLQVDQFDPPGVAAATAYVLTVLVPECDDSFDCVNAADAVCGPAGGCGDGPAECTGDDAAEAGGDDGPAGARDLTGAIATPVTLTDGLICNAPSSEGDFYQVTTQAAGEGLTVSLEWTGSTIDLDVLVFDGQGRILGVSYYLNPEVVTLTRLPVGTYYVKVVRFASTAMAAAVPYSITATRTAVDACTVPADCDDAYSTQVYRGACTGGACVFIEGAGARLAGQRCDTSDDCASDMCSYIVFEADAARSVCTDACTTDADCTAIDAGLTCTTGLTTNFCVPACDSDLECGADLNSTALDTDQPWDYFTCTIATGACTF